MKELTPNDWCYWTSWRCSRSTCVSCSSLSSPCTCTDQDTLVILGRCLGAMCQRTCIDYTSATLSPMHWSVGRWPSVSWMPSVGVFIRFNGGSYSAEAVSAYHIHWWELQCRGWSLLTHVCLSGECVWQFPVCVILAVSLSLLRMPSFLSTFPSILKLVNAKRKGGKIGMKEGGGGGGGEREKFMHDIMNLHDVVLGRVHWKKKVGLSLISVQRGHLLDWMVLANFGRCLTPRALCIDYVSATLWLRHSSVCRRLNVSSERARCVFNVVPWLVHHIWWRD